MCIPFMYAVLTSMAISAAVSPKMLRFASVERAAKATGLRNLVTLFRISVLMLICIQCHDHVDVQ